jgi:hypothetical protein
MKPVILNHFSFCIYLLAVFFIGQVSASEHDTLDNSAGDISPMASTEQVVEYPSSFFSRYKPTTALDMVRQLPGFLLDDGSSDRGFVGALGNILINDNYPSAKQDTPTAILTRIPANQVARIELIRGQVRGINLEGQSVVANLVLLDNSNASVRWETYIQHSNTGPLKPAVNVSLQSRWDEIEYNVGINIEREANGEVGSENEFDSSGELLESRFDDITDYGLKQLDVFLNTTSFINQTMLQFNGKFSVQNRIDDRISTRIPQTTGLENEIFFKFSRKQPSFELGFNAERNLSDELGTKAILLYTYRDLNVKGLQSNSNPDRIQTSLRIVESQTVSQEGIARMEFDWSGLADHNIQFNTEGVYNSVDGTLLQTVDTGTGPEIVNVPGANTLVEELRGEFTLKDTWNLGRFELVYGLAAEISKISQSGDTDQTRHFSFVKPQFVLSYSPVDSRQTRLMLAREVAQLNFNDFISATVFEDDDLALGNPDLRPDSTWVSELSHEHRFGSLGVMKLTAFHHWISDVADLLPLSPTFEAPGNIGDGRRWGLVFESTVPMEWLGLSGARLDIKTRWQDSSVVDPVTGGRRILSARQTGFGGPPTIGFRDNGSKYVFDVAFRQDLEQARVAWGVDVAEQGERPRFKVNELDVYNEELELNAFIETTRWFGIKIRLEANNILDYTETRERILYENERGLSPVESSILRLRMPGRRIKFVLSGSF